jgi:transcriptional regulator with GAF, ATPase, and Fis domain
MSREALLVRTLVELADHLVEDFDVIDVLTVLGDRCVETLDVASAGVMLAASSGELQVIASSSDAMRNLELFELQANEGPCVDCYQSGLPIVNLELTATDGRWPRFTRRAINNGFHSVHSLPMHLKDNTIGALNMFRTNTGPLRAEDVLVAQALADVATIVIIQHQTTIDAQMLNSQLNEALNSRIIIEQAKGKLSEAAGIDMDDAFRRLRSHARSHSLRLTDVAHAVAEGTMSTESIVPGLGAQALAR